MIPPQGQIQILKSTARYGQVFIETRFYRDSEGALALDTGLGSNHAGKSAWVPGAPTGRKGLLLKATKLAEKSAIRSRRHTAPATLLTFDRPHCLGVNIRGKGSIARDFCIDKQQQLSGPDSPDMLSRQVMSTLSETTPCILASRTPAETTVARVVDSDRASMLPEGPPALPPVAGLGAVARVRSPHYPGFPPQSAQATATLII